MKQIKSSLLAVGLVGLAMSQPLPTSAQTWTPDNGNGTFSNPILYDEFSDPDLIRVGSDYYLTGTTMHSMPGLPVLHSKDLVNWEFQSYAVDKLDFGPEYRLENQKEIYGQGIWAPSFRFHNGTFYIFANVRGQPMQMFTAKNPKGPWKQTAMKRGFHDPSVLFDDDGKVYVVWGSGEVRLAQLSDTLEDVVPGSERVIIERSAGMGEGSHFYKINGKYYITSAKYPATMPCARADKPEGPYEVNPAISGHEDFGIANLAMHQGGIVSTPGGEWWGFSMMDFNSLGRLTGLSPVTWKDGYPYFGLPGNLGRSPRTWLKPNTGASAKPTAPYDRNDDFKEVKLKPIWQWSHAPENTKWSLTERPGYLRLHSLPASEFWWARNSLTQRAVGPVSTPTTQLDISGMKPGDVAGLALVDSPYAWVGVHRYETGVTLEQFDKTNGETARVPLTAKQVWLRANCDFLTERSRFSYSTDGKNFQPIGGEFKTVFQLKTFQGTRYALFHYNSAGTPGGYADFAQFTVEEPKPRGLMTPIPVGRAIKLATYGKGSTVVAKDGTLAVVPSGDVLTGGSAARFMVEDRGQGRVALRFGDAHVSVGGTGAPGQVTLKKGSPSKSETFQWIETPQGDLALLSLETNRYLKIAPTEGVLSADSPGPKRDRAEGTCWSLDMNMSAPASSQSASAAPTKAPWDAPPLKDAYTGKFLVGGVLDFAALQGRDPIAVGIANRHFSAITPANSLKPQSTQPKEGEFHFTEGDRMVEIAQKSGATPIGHTLVWHGQTPRWFFEGPDGKPVTRELALERMRKHISTVVGHYKGKIKQWDVVNEAINDGPGTLRQTPWRQAIGDDYIAEAFRAAHKADPDAILIYNDYNIEMPYKRPKAIELLKSLIAQKVPINAVGIQCHWRMDTNLKDIEDAIKEFSALGLKIMITEMDIGVLPTKYQGADINTRETMTPEMQTAMNPYTKGLPENVAKEQAEKYRQAFEIFLRHKDVIGRVSLWGTNDGDSWLNDFPVRGRTDYALLFDREGKPKPAFFAVRKAAQEAR